MKYLQFYAEVKYDGRLWQTCQYQTKDPKLAKTIIREQWTMETRFISSPPHRDITIKWLA
jgi:hypothetical protein